MAAEGPIPTSTNCPFGDTMSMYCGFGPHEFPVSPWMMMMGDMMPEVFGTGGGINPFSSGNYCYLIYLFVYLYILCLFIVCVV